MCIGLLSNFPLPSHRLPCLERGKAGQARLTRRKAWWLRKQFRARDVRASPNGCIRHLRWQGVRYSGAIVHESYFCRHASANQPRVSNPHDALFTTPLFLALMVSFGRRNHTER